MTSIERVPSWEDNWVMMRQLWPDWSPTDEQVAELWCRSYDKPHAVTGPETINQTALKNAITACARAAKWKDPNFLTIAEAYRREKNEVMAQLERARQSGELDTEKMIVEDEHKLRLIRISKWSTERLLIAMQLVGKRFPTFANKSTNTDAWSPTYTGLLVAADEELNS